MVKHNCIFKLITKTLEKYFRHTIPENDTSHQNLAANYYCEFLKYIFLLFFSGCCHYVFHLLVSFPCTATDVSLRSGHWTLQNSERVAVFGGRLVLLCLMVRIRNLFLALPTLNTFILFRWLWMIQMITSRSKTIAWWQKLCHIKIHGFFMRLDLELFCKLYNWKRCIRTVA